MFSSQYCFASIFCTFFTACSSGKDSFKEAEKELKDFYQEYCDWKLKTWPEDSSGRIKQCEQIGRFLTALGKKCFAEVAQIFDYLGRKRHILSKTLFVLLLGNLCD